MQNDTLGHNQPPAPTLAEMLAAMRSMPPRPPRLAVTRIAAPGKCVLYNGTLFVHPDDVPTGKG